MKKILLTALLLTGVVHAEEISVKVNGMVCSMCAQGIQKKFSKEKAVKGLSVDMDKKIVLIETHPEPRLTDERIKVLITEAGYNVADIKRK